MMRPKNFSGDGTVFDSGTYDTSGETKCGSVVAAEIAWMEPGSGVSGFCAKTGTAQARNSRHTRNMGAPWVRPKFTTRCLPLGPMKKITRKVMKVHEGSSSNISVV